MSSLPLVPRKSLLFLLICLLLLPLAAVLLSLLN